MFTVVCLCVLANILNLSPTSVNATTYRSCNISIKNDLAEHSPLLIKTKFGRPGFALPITGTDIINVNQRKFIEIFCPGGSVTISNASIRTNLTRVTCKHGKFRLNNGVAVNLSAISCTKSPKGVAQYTGNGCLHSYKEFEIGYRYNKHFLTLIKGCFDKLHQITLYTVSTITKGINCVKLALPRKSYWSKGSFFTGVRINQLYIRNNQRITVNNQLGLSNEYSTKYITENDTNYYLSRGHLTPKADFIYGPQQDITFHFLNAVPQWQLLNAGNWKVLEANLRDLASSKEIDLKIYTGIAGILSFPHEKTASPTELYLHRNSERKTVPVPEYIWKIAYDDVNKKGVAFVGVNNPYLNGNYEDVTICANVCPLISYLHLNRDFDRYGYIYCCEVDVLRRKISTIPTEIPYGLHLLT
ncbi:hypothetical protein Trydic_g369 [Trypoxylus dichotomus]